MMNSWLHKFLKLPVLLTITICLISSLGFLVLYSAAGGNLYPWAYRQILNFALLFPMSILIATINIKTIYRFSYYFYFAVMFSLIAVEIFGTTAKGASRWLNLGFLKLQPSEPTKLAIVLMLARYFHDLKANQVNQFSKTFLGMLAVICPFALICKQPDLGTAIIVIIVAVSIFFASGIDTWKFIALGISVLGSLPIIWHMMYDYQKQRVMVFLDPNKDPLGNGYNIIQSKIAIGSGGLWGKGIGYGSQSHLDFLPEHQTDFVFATMSEELGFAGGISLLFLYSLVISISISIAINCRTMFGKLVSVGITTIFFSHAFINIAMVMGLLPAVGVPLPLVSYGGTMMSSMLIGFGLIMNAEIHRTTNF